MVSVNFEFKCNNQDYTHINNYIKCILFRYKEKRKQLSKKEAIVDAIANIHDYTCTYRLRDKFEECDYNSTCGICFEKSKCILTKCNHTFHKSCIQKWMKIKPQCPCCRQLFI